MQNFLKKLARFSLQHPLLGNLSIYTWVVVALAVLTIVGSRYLIDFSLWSLEETSFFVAWMSLVFVILFLLIFSLSSFVDIQKSTLPEIVIPQTDDIRRNNPEKGKTIDCLIAIANNDDNAELLKRWIFYFNQKKRAEAEMEKLEFQFL